MTKNRLNSFIKCIKEKYLGAPNIHVAYRPLFWASEIFGMSPLFFVKSGTKIYSITRIGIFMHILITVINIYSLYRCMWSLLYDPDYSMDFIDYVGLLFEIILGVILLLAVVASKIRAGILIPSWFDKIHQIDGLLRSLCIEVTYTKITRSVFRCLISGFLVTTYIWSCETFLNYGGAKFYSFDAVIVILPFINMNLHSFRYMMMIMILQERFRLLNNYLLNNLNKNYIEDIMKDKSLSVHMNENIKSNFINLNEALNVHRDLCDLAKDMVQINEMLDVPCRLVIFTVSIFKMYCVIIHEHFDYKTTSPYNESSNIWWFLHIHFLVVSHFKVATKCMREASEKLF